MVRTPMVPMVPMLMLMLPSAARRWQLVQSPLLERCWRQTLALPPHRRHCRRPGIVRQTAGMPTPYTERARPLLL
jgi:hypothetical protein